MPTKLKKPPHSASKKTGKKTPGKPIKKAIVPASISKKPVVKKPVVKKSVVKKSVVKKPVVKKPVVKKSVVKKSVVKKSVVKKSVPASQKAPPRISIKNQNSVSKKRIPPQVESATKKVQVPPAGFLAKQKDRLLALKDTLLDSMNGVAKDSLRSRSDGGEASAFGMHQADAGSDAYDRDFALSLLSQEQDSLYEIDEALKRIETGTYGVCEMSGKPIIRARLEALPFTRYTVECQAEIEKKNRYSRVRQPVVSIFGLGDDEGDDDDETSNDNN